MKRTVLMTILAISLTLGSSSAYGPCCCCRYPSADLSPWQQVLTFLPVIFWI
jgi:hypothetical protein